MVDASSDSVKSEKVPLKTKLSRRKLMIVTILAAIGIVVLCLVGFGIYNQEHNRFTKAQLELTKSDQSNVKLKQDNKALKAEAVALNEKVSSLTSQLKSRTKSNDIAEIEALPVATESLNIKVLNAYRYYTTKYPNNPYVVVNVTLTNTSKSELQVPLSSFSIADSARNTSTDFGGLAGEVMPDGKTMFGDQTLASGQAVTGALHFSAFNAGYSLYTLSYKSQTFPVDASETVKQ